MNLKELSIHAPVLYDGKTRYYYSPLAFGRTDCTHSKKTLWITGSGYYEVLDKASQPDHQNNVSNLLSLPLPSGVWYEPGGWSYLSCGSFTVSGTRPYGNSSTFDGYAYEYLNKDEFIMFVEGTIMHKTQANALRSLIDTKYIRLPNDSIFMPLLIRSRMSALFEDNFSEPNCDFAYEDGIVFIKAIKNIDAGEKLIMPSIYEYQGEPLPFIAMGPFNRHIEPFAEKQGTYIYELNNNSPSAITLVVNRVDINELICNTLTMALVTCLPTMNIILTNLAAIPVKSMSFESLFKTETIHTHLASTYHTDIYLNVIERTLPNKVIPHSWFSYAKNSNPVNLAKHDKEIQIIRTCTAHYEILPVLERMGKQYRSNYIDMLRVIRTSLTEQPKWSDVFYITTDFQGTWNLKYTLNVLTAWLFTWVALQTKAPIDLTLCYMLFHDQQLCVQTTYPNIIKLLSKKFAISYSALNTCKCFADVFYIAEIYLNQKSDDITKFMVYNTLSALLFPTVKQMPLAFVITNPWVTLSETVFSENVELALHMLNSFDASILNNFNALINVEN